MHVIIFMSIYLSFYKKTHFNLKILQIRVNYDELKINNFITHLYMRL